MLSIVLCPVLCMYDFEKYICTWKHKGEVASKSIHIIGCALIWGAIRKLVWTERGELQKNSGSRFEPATSRIWTYLPTPSIELVYRRGVWEEAKDCRSFSFILSVLSFSIILFLTLGCFSSNSRSVKRNLPPDSSNGMTPSPFLL